MNEIKKLFSANIIKYIKRTYGYLIRFKTEFRVDMNIYYVLAHIFINNINPTEYQIKLIKEVIHGKKIKERLNEQ